ncbi:MAG TPA: 50S ribosomal protein L21 [Burkholderiaceae bacterium]|nr:50S ribosomal protein L21 [Burkholderiaceae bacterium]
MYAVIKTGGKQYRVAAGDRIKVESIAAEVGQQVKLGDVLAVVSPAADAASGGAAASVRVGTPLLEGASVTATVLAHGRHDKVRIFKMRRRKHYQKHGGHRQNFTELRIDQIA